MLAMAEGPGAQPQLERASDGIGGTEEEKSMGSGLFLSLSFYVTFPRAWSRNITRHDIPLKKWVLWEWQWQVVTMNSRDRGNCGGYYSVEVCWPKGIFSRGGDRRHLVIVPFLHYSTLKLYRRML
jgi:hypothetical protein